jgi:hypothetical protein
MVFVENPSILKALGIEPLRVAFNTTSLSLGDAVLATQDRLLERD